MDDNVRVTVSELRKAVISELENYSSEAVETIKKVVREVANEAYDDLRTNPIVPKRSGKYAESFKIKLKRRRDLESIEISNSRHQLTHLLEKGHDIKRGGKKIGHARAYPHWKHAEEIANTLPDRIKEALK